MNARKNSASLGILLTRLAHDDAGAETVEAVIVTGFIVVGALIGVVMFGKKLAQRWQELLDALL